MTVLDLNGRLVTRARIRSNLDQGVRENEGLNLTRSQEQSGAVSAWCFVIALSLVAIAGWWELVRWVFA